LYAGELWWEGVADLPSQGDTGTGSRGLVHLTEHKGDLGLALEVDDTSLLHFVVKIVTLTSTLADAAEHGVTTVGLGDVVLDGSQCRVHLPSQVDLFNTHDELLNEHSLSDTGTAEKTNLTTTGVRGEEVDDLDTSDENLSSGGLLDESGSVGVDGELLLVLNGATLVNGLASDVHDAAKGTVTDGNHDGVAGVDSLAATNETLGTLHGNAADDVLTQMLLL
jgi:hypothetical protein